MSTPVQGILNLQDTGTDGNTVASGTLDFYAQSINGYMMPRVSGPNNQDTSLQTSVAFNRICMIGPGAGTNPAVFNTAITAVTSGSGAITHPTPTSTNLLTSVRSTSFSTGATAGILASVRTQVLECWRGNAAGLGGFFFVALFGTSVLAGTTTVNANRVFVGLEDVTTVPTNVDPTTSTVVGRIGVAINSQTGNWNFVNNVAGTAPTVTGLGANFPVNTTNLYRLDIYCPPNGSTISYQVTNLTTGSVTTGSVSTNIPTNTTFLGIQAWITNNTTAANAVLLIPRLYLETDA